MKANTLMLSAYVLSLQTLDDLDFLFVARSRSGRLYLTRDRSKAHSSPFHRAAALARELNEKGVAGHLWQSSLRLPPAKPPDAL